MTELIEEVALPEGQTGDGLIDGEEAVRLVMEASGWDGTSATNWLTDRIAGKPYNPLDNTPNIIAYYKDELSTQSGAGTLTPICFREPIVDRFTIMFEDIRDIRIRKGSLNCAISEEPNKPLETVGLIDGPTALRCVRKAGQFHLGEAQDWLRFNLEADRVKGWDAGSAKDACIEEIGPNKWPPLYSFKINKRIVDTGFNFVRGFDSICIDKSSFVGALKAIQEELAILALADGAPVTPAVEAQLQPSGPSRSPGAPLKWDWPAFEEHFRGEVLKRGRPDKLNEKGWRTQADVARWVLAFPDFTKGVPEETPDWSTVKGYVKRWMDSHAT